MWTYADDVHVTYTVLLTGALLLVTRPFVNRSEALKIAAISVAAAAFATPWDDPWSVAADGGSSAAVRCACAAARSAATSLWTVLCARWTTPCRSFNHDRGSHRLIRWAPIAVLCAAAVALCAAGAPRDAGAARLLGRALAAAVLWYGAGNFVARQAGPCAAAVVAPTAYMCWALGGTCRDAPGRGWSLLAANAVVVLAACAYDKARGVMDAYALRFPLRFAVSPAFARQMFRAFVTAECALPAVVTRDIGRCVGVLNVASKSFTSASFLFQAGIRLDLIILYAFCRVTDDMIDNELNNEIKKHKLKIIETFINELFSDRKSDYEVKTRPQKVQIDWEKYKSELTDVELSCFRAMSRTAFYLPRKPFYELLAGYKWDVEGRLVRNEDDLQLYSSYVAGSVGALCVFVMMYKCDNDKYELVENYYHVIKKAQLMGRVLQLVNIARDIVTDSVTLGRCYVPTEYMDDEEEEVRILCSEKNPRSLGDKKLKEYSSKMIQLANKYQLESVNAINCLPSETRGSVLAATEIYRGITTAIQSSPTYPTRASLSKFHKILIGLYSLYIKSI